MEIESLVTRLGLSRLVSGYRCRTCTPDREGTTTAAASSFNLADENESVVGWEGIKSTYQKDLFFKEYSTSVRVYLPHCSTYKEEELEKATQAGPYEELSYTFNARTAGKVDHSVAVPFMEVNLNRKRCRFVALNGSLYCLGGASLARWPSFAVNSVSVLRLQDKAVTSGPDMIHARDDFVALAVDGKIYAFGGVDLGDGDDLVDGVVPIKAWGEFLDTKAVQPVWKHMAPLPKLIHAFDFTAVVVEDGDYFFPRTEDEGGDTTVMITGGKAILVIGEAWTPPWSKGERVCFLYRIKEGTWRSISPECIPQSCSGTTVVAAEHTLYWFRGCLYAYDLSSQKMYATNGRVLSFHSDLEIFGHSVSYQMKNLHHLGGYYFCLTWCESMPWFLGAIHSSVIQVKRHEDFSSLTGHGRLDAIVVSSQFYLVPNNSDFDFNFSLLLDNTSSVKENLEDVGEEKVAENAWTV